MFTVVLNILWFSSMVDIQTLMQYRVSMARLIFRIHDILRQILWSDAVYYKIFHFFLISTKNILRQ
jgi:hypothetical protein